MPKEVLGESCEAPRWYVRDKCGSCSPKVLRGRWRIINNIAVQSTCQAA